MQLQEKWTEVCLSADMRRVYVQESGFKSWELSTKSLDSARFDGTTTVSKSEACPEITQRLSGRKKLSKNVGINGLDKIRN